MTAEEYRAWSRWWREHNAATRLLCGADTAFKYLGYLMYPLLLVFVGLYCPDQLVRFVAVPFLAFAAVTAFRHFHNAPRPYEMLSIEPLIRKDTKGHSMPSRHIFSMSMIALCWMSFCLSVGVVLLVISLVMAYVRVIGGVHFPRDVIAGLLVALAAAALGFLAVP